MVRREIDNGQLTMENFKIEHKEIFLNLELLNFSTFEHTLQSKGV